MLDGGYDIMTDGVRDFGGALDSMCDRWDMQASIDSMSSRMTQMNIDSMSYQQFPGIASFSVGFSAATRDIRGW